LRKFEQALLKFTGLVTVSIYLLELLLIVNLVLESPLHDVLADFLDAIDE
jgi:hypothetical protein